ncbi:MAG: hypothetical protein AB9879_06885 [Methanothrix sp.]|nr:hypothetical protein [Methanothrix sp.]
MKWLPGLVLIAALCIAGVVLLVPTVGAVPQNLTEHSWIYNQGYMDDSRIYQTQYGYAGQKLVTGTRGTGTVSRSIDASVYGGYEDGYNEISMNEWGVWQNKPSTFTQSLTQSDLKNALCAKNYQVGSVYSESYSNIRDLVKDTSIAQTDENSVYDIKTEIQGTAKIGARVQKSSSSVAAYSMSGTYMGYTNIHLTLETGNASILTLPCP